MTHVKKQQLSAVGKADNAAATGGWNAFKGEFPKLAAGAVFGALISTIVFLGSPVRDLITSKVDNWRPFGKPTRGNFTGDWTIVRMGQFEGVISLQQVNKTDIFGGYRVHPFGKSRDLLIGSLRAHRDTKSFVADLMWSSDTARWQVASDEISDDDATIEIKGTVQEWVIGTDGNWTETGKKEEFLAVAQKH